jgi:transcriptional regulator with XRE-family HTH domain
LVGTVTESVRIDGAKLKELRTARWLDRRELADRAGVNYRTVEAIETGKWPGGSRLSTVRKLAGVLEVEPHVLLEDK